jgi:hypothetical protein
MNIHRISIVNQQGSKAYIVGDKLQCGVIAKIELSELYFTGDPFSRYCGYDESGKLLFSVDPLLPCDVEYA